jgi:CRP-like cAMP-binding protein
MPREFAGKFGQAVAGAARLMSNLARIYLTGKVVNNRLLTHLAPSILEELAPYLEQTDLRRDQILYQPSSRIRRVHFIQSGFVVFTKMMRDGRSTMIGSAGCEGMTIPNILNGLLRTDIECSVHIEGTSLAIDADILVRLASTLPPLRTMLKRYDLFMDEQIAQLSGCNRLHALERRCARLLLTIHDNCGGQGFALTQEALAMMLGAQRPHVSAVAANFQGLELIQYKHGQMRVRNSSGLKSIACECYGFINERIDGTFKFQAE